MTNKYLVKIAELIEGEERKNSPLRNTITAVAANAPADIAGGFAGGAIGQHLDTKLVDGKPISRLANTRFGKFFRSKVTGEGVGVMAGGLAMGAAATYAAFKHRDKG